MSAGKDRKFAMGPPGNYGRSTQYAFWLITGDDRLIDCVRALPCVVQISATRGQRMLVEIADIYDADEVWHWIRAELERESQMVTLDKIWEDAIWLL